MFGRRRRDTDADARPGLTAGGGHAEQRQILSSLAALPEVTAREVMTPRVDVVALALPVSAEDVARAVRESGHSRFPVYEDDLDHLAGVLFVKDMFRMNDAPTPAAIERRLREPFLVPEGRKVLDLLAKMRTDRLAFGVVVDEYGGVEGVLTIKDLVSELVGDLHDEFDMTDDPAVSRVDSRRWLADGACPVDDLAEAVGIPIPDGEYVTLGGFLFDRFGQIPKEGDRYVHHGWELKVSEMERRRISKVVITKPSATVEAGGDRPAGK